LTNSRRLILRRNRFSTENKSYSHPDDGSQRTEVRSRKAAGPRSYFCLLPSAFCLLSHEISRSMTGTCRGSGGSADLRAFRSIVPKRPASPPLVHGVGAPILRHRRPRSECCSSPFAGLHPDRETSNTTPRRR